MKIMVAGASGQVGKDIVKSLSKSHKIYAIYRTKKKYLFFNKKNIKWIKYDLSKKINLNINPDILINCVATHEFSKKNELKNYFESNILSTLNLYEFAKKKKIKKIINFSTISIYGQINKNILDEKYIPTNQNLLGITKYMSEKILFYQPLNFINLRLPGILSSKNNKYRPWLRVVMNKIKKNKKITIYNHNKNFNNIIDTKEILRFISYFLNKKKKVRDSFNLSAANPIKLIKIIQLIKSQYKSKSEINKLKVNKTNNFVISLKKIKKEFNFYPHSTKKIILRNL